MPNAPIPMVLPFSEQGQLLEQVTDLPALNDLVFSSVTRRAIDRIVSENLIGTRLIEHGLRPSNRIMFRGPPGTGKTVTAGAVAHALGAPLFKVRQDALVQSYMGKTAAAMRLVFEFARTNRAVMLIDEADGVASARASTVGDGATSENNRIVAAVLIMLEEQRQYSQSVVIAATNHDRSLDAAMWRRFDEIITFERPDSAAVTALVTKLLKRHGYVMAPTDRSLLIRAMRGMSFAEVEWVTLYALKSMVIDDRMTLQAAFRDSLRQHRASGRSKL